MLLWQVESGDLARYGLIPEFIGRLPILVSLTALNEDQLVQVSLFRKTYAEKKICIMLMVYAFNVILVQNHVYSSPSHKLLWP